jgi:O-antigen/teichoic acid export membrane protein
MGSGIGESAVRGSLVVAVGFGASQVLRLAGNIVTAALLFEEAFALAAIAMAVLQGLAMFSDLGIGPSVVQHPRGDERDFLDTAWTLQVIRGVVLAVIASILGWPIAAIYAESDPMAGQLIWLLPLAALSTLFSSFVSPLFMTAARHLQLGRVTAVELASQVVGTLVMVIVSWWTREAYSLILGAVVGGLCTLLLSFVVFDQPAPRFRIERQAFWDIFHFGKWLFVSTLLTFLALQLDKLLFPSAFSLDVVGVYVISASFAALVPVFLGRLQLMIAFPVYSRAAADQGQLRHVFELAKRVVLALGGFIVAGMIGVSESFIRIAYDDRYLLAGQIIPILALAAWFVVLEGIYGAVFLATGRAQWVALTNAVKIVLFVSAFLVAQATGSVLLAVAAVLVGDAGKALTAILLARVVGLRDIAGDAGYTACILVVGVSVSVLGSWLREHYEWNIYLIFSVQVVLVAVAFLPGLAQALRSARQLRLYKIT